MRETWFRSLGWEDPLEKEMATHSSSLAWRIPWTEELGGLQSTGSQRVDTTERLHFHFHFLPYDPAIQLLGIRTKETRIETDTYTPLFIAALFIIARTWKQPRCPLVDEWIRKLWYIYTMEYYSTIKKNTFKSVLKRWMRLEPIMQSEVSQENTNTVY